MDTARRGSRVPCGATSGPALDTTRENTESRLTPKTAPPTTGLQGSVQADTRGPTLGMDGLDIPF